MFTLPPRHPLLLATLLLSGLLLSACNSAEAPHQVAEHFWRAVEQGDSEQAKQYALAGSFSADKLSLESGKFSSSFDETRVEGERAWVVTHHTSVEPNSPLNYQFETVLIKVDDKWKVDVAKTTQSLLPAAMKAAFSGLGQVLSESMGEIGNAFDQEAEKLGGVLNQVLNQGMTEMSRELEKAAEQVGRSGQQMATELSQELQSQLNSVNEQAASPAMINGTLMGTEVELTRANYQQALELYAGDNWGNNPSLLIFLFLKQGESLAGKRIQVEASNTSGQPHVHMRWRDPVSGEIKTEIATGGYDLTLVFSQPDTAGNIAATLAFSIPNRNTLVSGSFSLQP